MASCHGPPRLSRRASCVKLGSDDRTVMARLLAKVFAPTPTKVTDRDSPVAGLSASGRTTMAKGLPPTMANPTMVVRRIASLCRPNADVYLLDQ